MTAAKKSELATAVPADATTTEIIRHLDDSLGPGGWKLTIAKTNYPPGFVTVEASLSLRQNDQVIEYPVLGAAPIQRGRIFSALLEARRLALLDGLAQAGAAVQFPEEPEIEPAPRFERSARPSERDEAVKGEYVCDDCGEEIIPYRKKDGSSLSPKQIADWSQRDYGRPLCATCLFKELDKKRGQRGRARRS